MDDRLLGKADGLSSKCISKLLRKNGLKPHLVRTYKVSRDPEFTATSDRELHVIGRANVITPTKNDTLTVLTRGDISLCYDSSVGFA